MKEENVKLINKAMTELDGIEARLELVNNDEKLDESDYMSAMVHIGDLRTNLTYMLEQ